ncbi:MAG TPA: hypothetical protein PKY56_03230, partial [Candidatus Kapabacteria bacterium]|nr:hypothetical protein [Candidatus Kapabacteria bacterium]
YNSPIKPFPRAKARGYSFQIRIYYDVVTMLLFFQIFVETQHAASLQVFYSRQMCHTLKVWHIFILFL